MNILQVTRSLNPSSGGVAEGIRQFCVRYRAQGNDAAVVTLDTPGEPWLAEFPADVYACGPALGNYGYSSRLIPWLKQHAAAFDAIIVNGLWQYQGLATRHALGGSSVPYFVFTHGMLDPWFKRTYPLKHLKKWLYWPWTDYRLLRDARSVLFTCEEERRAARESFWLYRCKEDVVGYGIAAPPADSGALRTAFYEHFPELTGRRLFLYLSRIHPKKGCDLLLHAFADVATKEADTHLMMAGPDDVGWSNELRRLSKKLAIEDRVSWPGMLTGDLKWGAFHSAEVFVLPSHQENFGIVVAEAMACDLPVLISNKVNIWREIDAAGAGLIASDTLEGTRELLRRWNALSAADKTAMRGRTQACYLDHFTIDSTMQRLLAVVERETNRPVPVAASVDAIRNSSA
jgi:glycosyltransferase involved in cell wall biosynthesis